MKYCPFCSEEIRDEAIKCRYCGEFLDGRPDSSGRLPVVTAYRGGWGREYRSRVEFFGLPLVHITSGVDPDTGLPRVAKGIIAIGDVAIGGLAFGGIAIGGIALGGIGAGFVLGVGGLGVGGLALGGAAVGLYAAFGGMALAVGSAIGGLAVAANAVGGLAVEPAFLDLLSQWLPGMGYILDILGFQ